MGGTNATRCLYNHRGDNLYDENGRCGVGFLAEIIRKYLELFVHLQSAGAQVDVNAQELAARRTVIRCVQEYGLEADYPLDPLQERFAQLEKSKSDNRKRAGDSGKHQQPKKSRPNVGFRGFRGPPCRQAAPVYNNRSAYAGMPE
ncbi:Uncharacterized protein TCM_028912 [Theobroma cacao]|uniref:FRIGIDA-like protein n=1 Tax=Theobroma cacao TaxID=3641 RepID=A0A061GC12_THECC|nr:Uncharacterized protein TCM_028912 [Theobroma cacao]